MTPAPQPKPLLRSARWLLPPAALLLLLGGLGGQRALTVSRRAPAKPPQHHPHEHGPGAAEHHHGEGATHPVDTATALDAVLLAQNANNTVEIKVTGNTRQIIANGIPQHTTGTFPNANNPNRISAQSYTLTVPANPQFANQITTLALSKFGIAINGVPFDPGAAEFWGDGRGSGGRPQGGQPDLRNVDRSWQYEALAKTPSARLLGLDHNNAHVQPTGAYHYHGLPVGLVDRVGNGSTVLIGYAADGFPIYYSPNARSSYRLKSGTRPDGPGGRYDGTFVQDYEYVAGVGNLDQCNGGPVGTAAESYGYFITAAFPSIPRCFRGTPDASFKNQRPGGRGHGSQGRPQGHGRPDGPPPEGRPRPPHGRPPRHDRQR